MIEDMCKIDINKILNRNSICIDKDGIKKLIENKIVLITGGGGSIGSELCRQVIEYNPKKIIIFDIYENNLYDIETELNQKYDSELIEGLVGSIRDKNRLKFVFEKFKPDIIFHAAAHKHVPLMEKCPLEAIKNNVIGTYNLLEFSEKFDVKKFILISTDKAVHPTSVMGKTKRFCEMMVQAKNKNSKNDYIIVRFGNVLESNGSVVPLFKKQIENNMPVTVTDKETTRFFMTITEAVELILEAVSKGKGGELFVLDMGNPIKIYDLAEALIKEYGKVPNKDIKIEITGLRPGEKLYEEILTKEEGIQATQHDKIFIAKPLNVDEEEIKRKVEMIKKYISNETTSHDEVGILMDSLVGEENE